MAPKHVKILSMTGLGFWRDLPSSAVTPGLAHASISHYDQHLTPRNQPGVNGRLPVIHDTILRSALTLDCSLTPRTELDEIVYAREVFTLGKSLHGRAST